MADDRREGRDHRRGQHGRRACLAHREAARTGAEMIRAIKSWLPIRVLAAYGQSQASNYASALAFTCMLAMFPLMLGVLALIGYAVRDPGLEARAEALIIEVFPSTAQPQLLDAVHGVRQSAGWLGLLSLAGLLWSASSIFETMAFALTKLVVTRQRHMLSPQ